MQSPAVYFREIRTVVKRSTAELTASRTEVPEVPAQHRVEGLFPLLCFMCEVTGIEQRQCPAVVLANETNS